MSRAVVRGARYQRKKDNMAKAKLGTGSRFKTLKAALAKKGAKNPSAVAAYIGRKKYGKKRFQKLAAKGRTKKR